MQQSILFNRGQTVVESSDLPPQGPTFQQQIKGQIGRNEFSRGSLGLFGQAMDEGTTGLIDQGIS